MRKRQNLKAQNAINKIINFRFEISKEDLKKIAEDLPVIRIVDTLLKHAIIQDASDIHIEPMEDNLLIRYRIDGILRDAMILPKNAIASITARIKVLSNLKLENIWATQAQVAEVFGVNVRTVNEHIKNIYKTKELDEKATIRKIRIVQKEGKREVIRDVNHYNLDMVISVGYRINSKTVTEFRK